MALRPLTFNFNSIFIVQLLGPRDEPTGRSLSELLKAQARAGHVVRYIELASNADLLPALEDIVHDCRSHHFRPILHFETHGTETGLGLSNATLVSWEDLRPSLTALNLVTEINLIVTMAACYGASLIEIVRPLEPAPIWGVVGPTEQVLESEVRHGFQAFFTAINQTGRIETGLDALRRASVTLPDSWTIYSAELLFAMAYGQYLVRTGGPMSRREMELGILKGLKKRGRAIRAGLRAKIRRSIPGGRQQHFARLKAAFLALDKFPGNATRFPLELEDCISLYERHTEQDSGGAV